jgi:beta-lactamase regulating signal transducer with metallopeptidase domain
MNLASLLTLGATQSWNVSLILLLVKATLILIAALGITLAMQRTSAGARHLVWLVTLGALVLIPALTAWGPLRLEILPAASVTTAPRTNLSQQPAGSVMSENAAPPSSVSAATSPAPSAGVTTTTSGVLTTVRNLSPLSIVLALWGVVALAILASLAWSALTVRRLVRGSRPLDEMSWLNPMWEVSDRLGLTEPPRLLLSRQAKMPFACGLVHPTIVLPAECESWSHERRLAVLLHELAHVRRYDLVGHTLGRLVCAVYWFHPLVWTAAHRLRSESERACDDMALSCGTRATDYAEHLLDIVTSVRREGTPMVALAMARRKEFEGRMLAILDPELRHSTPSRRQSAALIATLAMISIVVGAAAPAPKSVRTSDGRVAQLDSARTSSSSTLPHADISPAPSPAPAATPAANSERREPHPDSKSEIALRMIESSSTNTTTSTLLSSSTGSAMPTISVSSGEPGSKTHVSVNIADVLRKALSARSGKGDKASDDRPILLAKVLRTDANPALRRVAAWGLAEYADSPVAAEALGTALRHDANEEVREMCAWALASGDDSPAATEALRAALRSDASVAVRRSAAWAIGSIGDNGSVSTLVAALSDASPDVRSRAIWAIGSIGPKQAPKPLIAMLNDKDPEVRELTAWALFTIEDPEAAPAIQAVLHTETDKDLQLSYIRALAALGEKSVDALRPLLESSDPRIKSMAVHALAGGHAAGPWPRPMPQPRPTP